MSYQPIKLTKRQYNELKALIRKDFGNISLPQGLYIISYIYNRHTNTKLRNFYRKKYFRPFNAKRRYIKRGK